MKSRNIRRDSLLLKTWADLETIERWDANFQKSVTETVVHHPQ